MVEGKIEKVRPTAWLLSIGGDYTTLDIDQIQYLFSSQDFQNIFEMAEMTSFDLLVSRLVLNTQTQKIKVKAHSP